MRYISMVAFIIDAPAQGRNDALGHEKGMRHEIDAAKNDATRIICGAAAAVGTAGRRTTTGS